VEAGQGTYRFASPTPLSPGVGFRLENIQAHGCFHADPQAIQRRLNPLGYHPVCSVLHRRIRWTLARPVGQRRSLANREGKSGIQSSDRFSPRRKFTRIDNDPYLITISAVGPVARIGMHVAALATFRY